MHRDTKLGLALAILVMGFAAALCFPRETGDKVAHLDTQLARELDTAIRHKPVKPYTDADFRRVQEAPVVSVPAESNATESAQEDVFPIAESAGENQLSDVPDPIPVPETQEQTPVEPEAFPADVVAEEEAEPVMATRSYTVVFGDSLSRIAERELGSSGPRAVDMLFEANRHQMNNRDSLVPGMTLVIPIPEGDVSGQRSVSKPPLVENQPAPVPSSLQPVTGPSTPTPRKRFGGSRVGSGSSPRLN